MEDDQAGEKEEQALEEAKVFPNFTQCTFKIACFVGDIPTIHCILNTEICRGTVRASGSLL